MLVRLCGVALGSWLLRYGALAANLSSVSLGCIAIPILGLLPQSVAQALKATKPSPSEQQKPIQQNIGFQPLIPKSVPDPSSEAGVAGDAAYGDYKSHSEGQNSCKKSCMVAVREAGYARTVQRHTHLLIHNPFCFMSLAIMFTNSLAMDVRNQVKTWISTRYGLPLAHVGYVLSAESVVSVAVLFALPWLDRVPRRPPPVSRTALVEVPAASRGHDGASEAEDLVGALCEKRRRELRVARLSLGFGAAGAFVIMLAADRAIFVLGLVVMTGAVGFPDAVRAYCTSFFAAGEIQALYAAVTVMETLGVVIGSPVWGWIFAQAYRGGSLWIGMPFGIWMVFLLCTLGLLLRLKP
ncbi:MAG: hypothetical protein Q9195_006010 [Heterodermia aff. obscurata]